MEEWDKLCEVQSDKASVEITSRFSGVIKKLHYDAGEMAQVGKPLVDIDIQGEIKDEDLAALTAPESAEEPQAKAKDEPKALSNSTIPEKEKSPEQRQTPIGKHSSLATPAVRHLTKELGVNIIDVDGTGKDGRVLKEDVQRFAKQRDSGPATAGQSVSSSTSSSSSGQQETLTPLSNMQAQMFKSMTKSLAIPHFSYADEIDFTGITSLRTRLNKTLAKLPVNDVNKLSFLPFIIKAVSMAIHQYPIINARVDVDPKTSKPALVMRSQHNVGVAMDTPSGLMVPVIKNVSNLNILSIAAELNRLQGLAATGKLSTQDLTGGTITVSNIGNVGGTYLCPVIVGKEVAILGMGKIRTIPAFSDEGQVVKKQVSHFSWSADHRVIDGATMARAAEVVRGFVEDPDSMVVHLR